jgi:hypothetical protein
MDFSSAAQLTLVFGGFLGQDMTFESLRALDAPAGAELETLCRPALGFHFGHNYSLSYGAGCFPEEKLGNPYTTCYRDYLLLHPGHPLLPRQL